MKIKFLLLFLMLNATSYAQHLEIAIKYNDHIVEMNERVIVALEELIDSYETYIPEKMDSLHELALQVVDAVIKKTTKLAPLENDSTFKYGALKLFKTYKTALEDEHKWIIELLKLPADQYGDEENRKNEKYMKGCNNAIEKELDKLLLIQEAFAKKFNIDLTDE